MRQTLFYVPSELFGLPLFGFGLLFAVWLAASLIVMAWLVRRQGFSADTMGYLWVLLLVGAAIVFIVPAVGVGPGIPVRGFGMMLLLAVCAALGLGIYRARRMGIDPDLVSTLAVWLCLPGIVGARLYYVIDHWESIRQPSWSATLLEIVNIPKGGLVVYGSIIGGFFGLLLFIRRYRVPLLVLCDLIAPSLMIGLAFGRVGCFLNGCCYGGLCQEPWGVAFPWGSPPHVHQWESGQIYLDGLKLTADASGRPVVASVEPGSRAEQQGIKQGDRIQKVFGYDCDTIEIDGRKVAIERPLEQSRAILLSQYDGDGERAEGRLSLWDWLFHRQRSLDELFGTGESISIQTNHDAHPKRWIVSGPPPRSLPVHPTQLYSVVDAMVICLFLLAWYPFRRHDGELAAWLGVIYPITRLMMEFVRDDEPVVFLGLKTSQWISLSVVAVSAAFWLYLLRQPKVAQAPLSPPIPPQTV